MVDLVDLAQEREEAHRAAALDRVSGAGAGPYPPAPAAHSECARCGDPIALDRLAALPQAETCIACQRIIEAEERGHR